MSLCRALVKMSDNPPPLKPLLARVTPESVPSVRRSPVSPKAREVAEAIVNAVREFGPRWCSVATCLPQRTEQAVRNRWNRLQQRARVQARALSIRRAAAAGAGQQGSESPQHSLGQTSPVCA